MGRAYADPTLSAFNELYYTYKRSAKRRGLTFRLDRDLFRLLTQLPCFYCLAAPANQSRKRYTYNGIDRIDNAKHYTPDNVVSCCRHCNAMKSGLTVENFLEQVCRIYYTFTS